MGPVEGDGGLPRPRQTSDHAQLAGRDHGLIDDDVGHGRRAAQDHRNSCQQPPEHRPTLLLRTLLQLRFKQEEASMTAPLINGIAAGLKRLNTTR
jgi:hypothetical protein